MNYHDQSWIMNKMQEHYNEVLQYYTENEVLGLFLFGSQNYNCDTSQSDIDTKAIILSTSEKYIGRMHRRANGEIIFFIDARYLINGLKEQITDYFDILLTPYYILNPRYKHIIEEMHNNLHIIFNGSTQKQYAYLYEEASRNFLLFKQEVNEYNRQRIETYGYDNKSLYHLYRFYQLIKYVNENHDYSWLPLFNNIDNMLKIKSGTLNLEQAYHMAITCFKGIEAIYQSAPVEISNEKTINLLNSLLEKIYITFVKEE